MDRTDTNLAHEVALPQHSYIHVVEKVKTHPREPLFTGIEGLLKQQDKKIRLKGRDIYGDNNFRYFMKGDRIIYNRSPRLSLVYDSSEAKNLTFNNIGEFILHEGKRKGHIPGYFYG